MSDLKYHILDSLNDVPDHEGELVFDLETTSLDTHNEKTRIVTIGLCWEEGVHYRNYDIATYDTFMLLDYDTL